MGKKTKEGLYGLILLTQCGSGRSCDRSAKEALLREGFRRMGWPQYRPERIRRTRNGKPVYIGDAPYFFNCSDTGSFLAAVFAGCPAGIDIERPRRCSAPLYQRLPAQEREFLEASDGPQEQERCFARIWTAKEAYGKMTGVGIEKEILDTSFAGVVRMIRPALRTSDAGEEEAARMFRLPDTAAARFPAEDSSCVLTQAENGEIMISVCTAGPCTMYIAFLTRVR